MGIDPHSGGELAPPEPSPPNPSTKELRWTALMVAGALSTLAAIAVLELLVIKEIVPPLVGIAVLLVVGLFLMSRGARAGVIVVGVVGLVYLGLSAPFIGEAFSFPASTLDFVLNLVTILSSLAMVVGAVAAVRARSNDARSPSAYKLGVAMLILLIGGAAVSIVARLTREDPLGQPQDITVTAEDTEFTPKELSLTGDLGASPRLSFFIQNEDLTAHTFTIDELDVDEPIPGGGSARVQLEGVQAGTYEYYCTVTGHDDMKGTLTLGSVVELVN
jgi:plastocyanin